MVDIGVSVLRVSYITVSVHDGLKEIGGDLEFAERVVNVQPVDGLAVTMPFGDGLSVDTQFWSRIAEQEIRTPVPPELARRLVRGFVPLRWSGQLTSAALAPRLEAHLHRFGVVAIVTVDVKWEPPVAIEEVWRRIEQVEGQPATVTFERDAVTTTLGEASAASAKWLIGRLGEDGSAIAGNLRTHRLATVISGSARDGAAELQMPPARSPLHIALHRLAGGDDVIAAPSSAFVAQFGDADYSFPPTRMMYTLSKGSAVLLQRALLHDGDRPSASDWHRERLLLASYVMALTSLVEASPRSTSGAFNAWARLAAGMLGRLYGPAAIYTDWGLLPAAIIGRSGLTGTLNEALGRALEHNADYPLLPYG